jgi:hypothetical protein
MFDMNKFTEDANAIYSEIVSVVLSFPPNKDELEKVYILGEISEGNFENNCLYQIAGRVLDTKETSEYFEIEQKASYRAIFPILRVGNEELMRLKELFQGVEQEVPKGIRLDYNVRTGGFSAKFSYEPVTTDEIGMHDAIHAWHGSHQR